MRGENGKRKRVEGSRQLDEKVERVDRKILRKTGWEGEMNEVRN